jgi:uncharacterized membrane protein
MARLTASALLVLGCLWAAVVAATPCLDVSGRQAMTMAARAMGRVICHQRPERSFTSCGQTWVVCGRCAGLYAGVPLAVAGLALPAVRRRRTWSAWRRVVLLAAVPTAVFWSLETSGLLDPGTLLRWAAAVPLGAAVAAWLTAMARGELR